MDQRGSFNRLSLFAYSEEIDYGYIRKRTTACAEENTDTADCGATGKRGIGSISE